jgi:polysaccharide export outer membrane protein
VLAFCSESDHADEIGGRESRGGIVNGAIGQCRADTCRGQTLTGHHTLSRAEQLNDMSETIDRALPRARSRWKLFPSRRFSGFLAILALLANHSVPGATEYILRPGDVLAISGVGLPELEYHGRINLDGVASFPLLGQVQAAGMPLSEFQAKVRQLLPSKVLRRRTQDGREYTVTINSDEITLSIAEYRPVYVDGDVAKPGDQPFRPGITVRKAIAAAGGYDVMRFRGHDPFLESADLRAEYYSLWTQFAKEQAHVSRIRTELSNGTKLDRTEPVDTPVPRSVVSEIEDLEARLLDSHNADYQKEIDYLRRAIQQEESRIEVLRQTEQKEQQGAKADANDLEQMEQNYKKGVIPITRVSETRRLALLSATQALQTTAALALVERGREELRRSLEKVDDHRRIDLLKELNEAEVGLQTIRSRLQAVGDKLIYTGLLRSQLVRGTGRPKITIFRNDDASGQTFSASEDTELAPGDVVEVALRIDGIPSSAPSDGAALLLRPGH